MKPQGTLALFLAIFLVVCGASASATGRSTRTWQFDSGSLAEGVVSSSNLDAEASIDASQGESAKRKVLLNRLNKAEALATVERQALRAQQQVVIALEQEQEVLASKVNALEAARRKGSSRLVLHKRHARRMAHRGQPLHTTSGSPKPVKESELVVLLHGVEEDFWKRNNDAFWGRMTSIAAYICQVFIVAVLYMQFCKQSVTPKLPENQVRTDEFQYGVCESGDIARDCQMCLCAFCCPWIRWAESASKESVQFLAFIPALFITALLSSAASITFAASLPILLLITVLCRQRIRDIYGLPSGTCWILAGDCLLWICCPCCAIVQEARQVEYVDVPMQEYGIPPTGQ